MASIEVSHKAAVEVIYKAAGVRSSSKITGSYVLVASFPGLPHIIAFSIHSRHFRDHQRHLSGKGFPGVRIFSAMTSHKSLIASQKCDGHTCIHTTLAAISGHSPRSNASR